MCGIIGLYAPGGVSSKLEDFDRAMRRMRTRGPDDSGVWRAPNIWFGHQRLAVMDTSSAGHQPMISPDGRFVLLFNGAIYNHLSLRTELDDHWVWRSNCDTETLLAAFARWGIDCLARLQGMFAFAVWDKERQQLHLARDRMGVKPLYYGWHSGQLVFASRPTAAATLLPDAAREMDHQSLRWYLECGFIPGQRSLYRSLSKLPPAHYMVCKGGTTRLIRYWDYRHLEPAQTARPEAELHDEFQSLFDSAVKSRLQADVPLGLFLSSGVDSSLVAASMCRSGASQHRAFTISFPDSEHDEAPLARQIARHLQLELVTEDMSAGDLLKALPGYLGAVDEPIADSAGIATIILSEVAARHITVALTGDGGDELFGGYPHYLRLMQLSATLHWPAWLRRMMAGALHMLPGHKSKLLAGTMGVKDQVVLFHYLRSMSKDFPLLIQPEVSARTVGSVELFEQCAASFALDLHPVELGGRLDMAFTLPDLYLQKIDMATMAHSIEARSPFMDHRLVEWAMHLPAEYKYDGRHGKSLLKKQLCRSLPAEWVYRQKRGFSVPIGQWLSGPLYQWAADSLRDSSLTSQFPVDWRHAQKLLEWQVSGKRNTYPLVWAVLMLIEFVRHHGDLDSDDQVIRMAS